MKPLRFPLAALLVIATDASPAAPVDPRETLGLWETTTIHGPPQQALPRNEWAALGMDAFKVGRPMKTVSCTYHPASIVFFDCEKQVAAGGGTCRVDQNRDIGGVATEREVTLITGDFRTRFHIQQTQTLEYKNEPRKYSEEATYDHRYLGLCKPGMERHTTFHVKDNGEWVTAAQLKDELEGKPK
jgi:hypothetical protein